MIVGVPTQGPRLLIDHRKESAKTGDRPGATKETISYTENGMQLLPGILYSSRPHGTKLLFVEAIKTRDAQYKTSHTTTEGSKKNYPEELTQDISWTAL